jgi:hypothetical protein
MMERFRKCRVKRIRPNLSDLDLLDEVICMSGGFPLRNIFYYFFIGIVGIGVQLGPLVTAKTNGLVCQPRLIIMMEKLVE